MSDIHGEYRSFCILKCLRCNQDKITQIYGRTLSNVTDKFSPLLFIIRSKSLNIKDEVVDINDWYKITLYRLIEVCRVVASKYTCKNQNFYMEAFGSTIDELIHANTDYGSGRETYYNRSISINPDMPIVLLGNFNAYPNAAIGRLHIMGDIFDRGPEPYNS